MGIALAIICILFLIQRFGTRIVGSAFSPVVLLWLLFNAMIGIYNIHTYGADVFRAFGPNYWFAYLLRNGHSGWKSLGGVVLCITGTALQWCSCTVLHSMPSCNCMLQLFTLWIVHHLRAFGGSESSCTSAGAEALFADLGHFSMRSIQVHHCCGTYAAVIKVY